MPAQNSGKPFLSVETSVSKAFLAEALGVSFEREYYFDPWVRREIDARCHRFTAETLRDLDAFYTESNLGRKAWFEPGQVLVGGIQPNLILGQLFGADFIPAGRGDADISPACWAGRSMGELPGRTRWSTIRSSAGSTSPLRRLGTPPG